MTTRARSAAVGVLLAGLASAGCQMGSRVEIPVQTTTTSTMAVTLEESGPVENTIRTEGRDTVASFRGKIIILRNRVGYTGVMTPFSMKFAVQQIDVSIDEQELTVTGPDFSTMLKTWKDVDGQKVDLLGDRKVIITDVPPYVTMEGD